MYRFLHVHMVLIFAILPGLRADAIATSSWKAVVQMCVLGAGKGRGQLQFNAWQGFSVPVDASVYATFPSSSTCTPHLIISPKHSALDTHSTCVCTRARAPWSVAAHSMLRQCMHISDVLPAIHRHTVELRQRKKYASGRQLQLGLVSRFHTLWKTWFFAVYLFRFGHKTWRTRMCDTHCVCLQVRDLVAASGTCCELRHLARDDVLWRPLFEAEFGQPSSRDIANAAAGGWPNAFAARWKQVRPVWLAAATVCGCCGSNANAAAGRAGPMRLPRALAR